MLKWMYKSVGCIGNQMLNILAPHLTHSRSSVGAIMLFLLQSSNVIPLMLLKPEHVHYNSPTALTYSS